MVRSEEVDSEEASKLFHIRENLHARAIPLFCVYDPDYDGEHVPDWADDPDWFFWVEQNGEFHSIDGFPAESLYFGKKAEKEDDVYYDFLNFIIQHISYSWILDPVERIIEDIRNLAACVSKLGLYQKIAHADSMGIRRFVVSELEYIFSVCRSLYDLLQELTAKLWQTTQVEDGGKNELPRSFAKMALSGNDPVPSGDLEDKYGIPSSLAEFYEAEAEGFSEIRDFRDDIIHSGETVDMFYVVEEGFAIPADLEPFSAFVEWEEDDLLENDLAPLWPPIAIMINHTLGAMQGLLSAFVKDSAVLPEIAPDYKVFVRGYHIENLAFLPSLVEDDVWGGKIVESVESRFEGSI